jgi:DNA-binding NtrC family response regulator
MQIEKQRNGHQPVVLIADDDNLCLDVGMKMLQKLGCRVLGAKDGKEAIPLFTENHADIDLVILDMKMQYNGVDTFKTLKEIKSDVKVLIATGFTEDHCTKEMKAQGCLGFIQKPFSISLLSDHMTHVLNN